METQKTNISGVSQSVISIGSSGSLTNNVSQQTSELRVEDLQRLLSQLAVMLPDVPLHESVRAEARAELRTAQAQLGSPRPKLSILRESLHTIRGILEGIAGNASLGHLVQTMVQLTP